MVTIPKSESTTLLHFFKSRYCITLIVLAHAYATAKPTYTITLHDNLSLKQARYIEFIL